MDYLDVLKRQSLNPCSKTHNYLFDVYFINTHQLREICKDCGNVRIYPVYYYQGDLKYETNK